MTQPNPDNTSDAAYRAYQAQRKASDDLLSAAIASPLVQAAIAMRELYLAYRQAGFTLEEAVMLCAAITRPQPPENGSK